MQGYCWFPLVSHLNYYIHFPYIYLRPTCMHLQSLNAIHLHLLQVLIGHYAAYHFSMQLTRGFFTPSSHCCIPPFFPFLRVSHILPSHLPSSTSDKFHHFWDQDVWISHCWCFCSQAARTTLPLLSNHPEESLDFTLHCYLYSSWSKGKDV